MQALISSRALNLPWLGGAQQRGLGVPRYESAPCSLWPVAPARLGSPTGVCLGWIRWAAPESGFQLPPFPPLPSLHPTGLGQGWILSLEGLQQCPGTRRAQRCWPGLQGKIVRVRGGPGATGPRKDSGSGASGQAQCAAAGHTHLRGGSSGGGGNQREPGPGREPPPSGAASGAQEWMPRAAGALLGFGFPQGSGCGLRRREGGRPVRGGRALLPSRLCRAFPRGSVGCAPLAVSAPCWDPGPGLAPWPWSVDLFYDKVPGEALLVSLCDTEGSGQEAPHVAQPPRRGLTPSGCRLTAAAPSPAAWQNPGSPRARGQRLR